MSNTDSVLGQIPVNMICNRIGKGGMPINNWDVSFDPQKVQSSSLDKVHAINYPTLEEEDAILHDGQLVHLGFSVEVEHLLS